MRDPSVRITNTSALSCDPPRKAIQRPSGETDGRTARVSDTTGCDGVHAKLSPHTANIARNGNDHRLDMQ
jgi:hypothetical protein